MRERNPVESVGLRSLSENSAGRGQILSILQVNSCSIDQESGGIWTVQADLQQIYPKSDRLLDGGKHVAVSALDFRRTSNRGSIPNPWSGRRSSGRWTRLTHRCARVSGYKKKLRPAVLRAIDHVVALVEGLPPPMPVHLGSYDEHLPHQEFLHLRHAHEKVL